MNIFAARYVATGIVKADFATEQIDFFSAFVDDENDREKNRKMEETVDIYLLSVARAAPFAFCSEAYRP